MAQAILMPQVGQDLTEGKILEITVKPGDEVKKGDIVATVESEKAAFEVEAFEEGHVLKICYNEGEWGKVLEPIIYVGEQGESIEGDNSNTSNNGSPPEPKVDSKPVEIITESNDSDKIRISPLARKIASLNTIDVNAINGTGPRGAIVKRDIETAISEAKTTTPEQKPLSLRTEIPAQTLQINAEDVEIPHSKMRQIIADRLSTSKQTVPHFYLEAEADVTDILANRKAFNEKTNSKVTINDILIQSSALTLMEYRAVNAHVNENSVVHKGDINIGFAVSVEQGLMVPVVGNADKLSILEISKTTRDLADSARRGVSKSTAAGTFSISNLGMFGINVLPIINPPEAAILGVGNTKEEVRPYNGGIHVRQIMRLNLSADHRALDGALAAQFLARLVEVIENFKLEA